MPAFAGMTDAAGSPCIITMVEACNIDLGPSLRWGDG